MLDYFYPDAGEKYLYVGIFPNNPWSQGCIPMVLAVPIRAGKVNHIRDTDTSRFIQGRNRSYCGATDVRHIKVDGELELEFDPKRAERIREHRKRYRGHGLSDVCWRYSAPNGGFDPSPSGATVGGSDPNYEEFSLFPCTRHVVINDYDPSWDNPDHFAQCDTCEGIVFGFRDSGVYAYSWTRAWCEDTFNVEIHWNLDRSVGKLEFEVKFNVSIPRGGLSMCAVTQDEFDTSYLLDRFREGFWESTSKTTISFSEELARSMKKDRRDQPAVYTAYDFYVGNWSIQFGPDEWKSREYNLTTESWEEDRVLGWGTVRIQAWIGYAPEWGAYHMVLPGTRLDQLFEECRKLVDWEVGSQRVAISYAEVENYNLGFHQGKDRGGYTVWTPMQKDAIAGNRYIDNSIWTFLRDIKNAYEDWSNLADAFKADAEFFMNHRRSDVMKIHWIKLGKNGANTYLPILYGWRLTQAEAESLGDSILKLAEDDRYWDTIRHLGPIRRTERINGDMFVDGFDGELRFAWQADVVPESNRFSELYAFLDERKLWLSLEDAWDWVKYSFVVNWVTSVPLQLLQWYDFQAWKQNYYLLQCIRSMKLVGKVDAFSVIGDYAVAYPSQKVELTYYERYWNPLFDPMPSFLSEPSDNGILSHFTEVTALVVQRF